MSAWTSMEAELANRLINSDLDIPLADAERLESHHNGKRCILTGLTPTRGALEWAHLIPGCVKSVRAKLMSTIRERQLCESCARTDSFENVVPLDQGFHSRFDSLYWTFFPTLNVLLAHIHLEESWRAGRKRTFETDGVDVDRPDYLVLLDREVNPFEVHWSSRVSPCVIRFGSSANTPTFEAIENGAFPTLHLLAGVPNVVYACLPRLANILRFPWSPAGSAYTRRVMELAIYLTELWEWDLGDVEPARPRGLPPLGTNSDTSPMAVPGSSLMASDAPFGDKTLNSQIVSDLAMTSYCMDEVSSSGSRSHTRLSAQALSQIDRKASCSLHLESDNRSVMSAAQPAQYESRLTCSFSDPPPNNHSCDDDQANTNASISSWLEKLPADALTLSPTDVFDETTEVAGPGITNDLTRDDIDMYGSIEIEQGVPFEAVLFWTAKPGPGRADVLWKLADGV